MNASYQVKYPKMDNGIRIRETTRLHYARVINKVDDYCEAHLHESFGIAELADYVHLSYHHLTDIFSRLRSTSLGTYILTRRLERAAQLSCYTNLNLTEIAEKTGFATKHSLSKAFKHKFAGSPGQWSRQSLYHPQSPNVRMDGIRSESHYNSLIRAEHSFCHRQVVIRDGYLVGNTWQTDFSFPGSANTSHGTMKSMIDMDQVLRNGRMCLKAFDSVNFSDIVNFKFFYGIYLTSPNEEALRKMFVDYLIIKLKTGTYIAFDVPAGTENDVGAYITLCRENAIWYKRIYRPCDFSDFFLYTNDNPAKAGEYYIYYRNN